MPGGWTCEAYLTPYDGLMVYNASLKENYYFYTPIAVATQVVNGTNYKFMTIAEPQTEDLNPQFAVVDIYQPINGKPYLTSIAML